MPSTFEITALRCKFASLRAPNAPISARIGQSALLMKAIERDPADFLTFLIGDKNGECAVLQFRPFLQEPLRQQMGRVHGSDIMRHFRAAFIRDRLRINQIEVKARH
jgi:hypothetical protein